MSGLESDRDLVEVAADALVAFLRERLYADHPDYRQERKP